MDPHTLQEFRAEVIARKNLPTIPTVLAKIVQLTGGETANARDLVALVEHDQALTSKILRLANSAFFGQSRRVATIPRAVVLLGFSTVRNLALGVKVWESLGSGIARSRLEALWEHSVTVAVAAKTLVSRLRAGDPDEAFTAGLLHDIGRLVLAMRFREEYWAAVAEAGSDAIHRVESSTFGVDHAEVGGWMLEAWSLPPGIVEAVRWHHEGLARPGVVGLVAMTNRLLASTDLATGALTAEAAGLERSMEERGLTHALWEGVVSGLQESEILGLRRLDG
jgi:putative nucleotidyltransferase with HDIG domain